MKSDTRIKLFNDNSDSKKEYVYRAIFYKHMGKIDAIIKIYTATYMSDLTSAVSISNDQVYVNTTADWFYHSELWFKYNKLINDYDSFNSYIDEYREYFTVEMNKPLLVFNANIN